MALIFARSICRKEFKGGDIPQDDLKIIIHAFEKGIFAAIRGEHLPEGTRLIKIYATSVHGARRILYLMKVASGDAFLLMYRTKKDAIGENMSIQNPKFRKLLKKHLELLEKDIESGNYLIV